MAKVKNNVVMRGISGTLGRNFVVRTMRDGSTIISANPDFSNRKFSKGQLTPTKVAFKKRWHMHAVLQRQTPFMRNWLKGR